MAEDNHPTLIHDVPEGIGDTHALRRRGRKTKHSFRVHSIRTKLLLLTTLNSSLALLVAGVSFLGYQTLQYRDAARRELTTLADIVSVSSTAALTFGDDRAADETLSSL